MFYLNYQQKKLLDKINNNIKDKFIPFNTSNVEIKKFLKY